MVQQCWLKTSMPGLAIDKLSFSLQADLHNHQLTRLLTFSHCNLCTSFDVGMRVCPPTDIGMHATAQDTARDATVNVIREVGVPRLMNGMPLPEDRAETPMTSPLEESSY